MIPIEQKALRAGCAPRGEENYRFAIPLGRESASQADTLFQQKIIALMEKSYYDRRDIVNEKEDEA